MRRKSERNKVRSPEKKVEKPSRRTRRRRGTPESDEEPQSENEVPQTSQEEVKTHPEAITKNPSTDSKESNSNSDEETKEQSVWQVKSAETPSDTGEIQKLKICLQRPASSERSPRKHHGSSQESADSSEEVRKKRSKKTEKKIGYQAQEEINEVAPKKETTETVETDQIDNCPETQPENKKPEDVVPEVEPKLEEPKIDKKVTKIDLSVIDTEKVLNNDEEPSSSDNVKVSTNEKSETVDLCNSQVPCETNQKPNIPVEVDNHSKKNEEAEKIEPDHKENTESEQVAEEKVELKVETVSESVEKETQNDKETVEETSKTLTPDTPEVTKSEATESEVTKPVEDNSKPEEMETNENEKPVEATKPRRNSHFKSRSPEKSEVPDKNGETVENSNSTESASGNAETEKVTRKRRWGSKRTVSTDKKPVLAISTDSLKNLISDVKPLSVNDVQLEVKNEKSQTDFDKTEEKPEESKDDAMDTDKLDQSEKDYEADDPPSDQASDHSDEVEKKKPRSIKTDPDRNDRSDHSRSRRKISVNENVPVKKSSNQPKSKPSEVLYITNLVRPFTVLQLKGLLARTGKLTENGFWIDNIKSKCFVHYENEDQAVETRHALHGTRWPASNPKLLQVEFSTVEEMEKCVSSVPPPAPADNTVRRTIDSDRVAMAWLAEQNFKDERNRGRDALRDKKQSVREWDMGKQDPSVQESPTKYPRDVPVEYPREAISRERRDERFDGREKRRSRSRSPVRRFKRKDEEAPAKRLDDLFRKTKVTPCIYWLPLTPEQISVKEEMRRQHMAEHERRKEEIRKQERERERERQLHREKQNSSNRDRDRRRNSSHHNSRSGDRNNH